MAEWPTGLPAPQKKISITPGDTRVERKLQSGRTEFRRFGNGKPDEVKVLIRLMWVQWETLKHFYERDLNLGLNWFTASWLADLGYSAHSARFVGYPREVATHSFYVDIVCAMIVQKTAWVVGEDTVWPCAATGGEPAPPASGDVVVFGDDTYHQISGMPAGLKAKKVVCGYKWAGAVKEDGTLVFWGDDAASRFGGTYETVGDIVDIASGNVWCACLNSSGNIVVVGYNAYDVYNFPAIADGVAVHATTNKPMVVRADGSCLLWGNASYPSLPSQAQSADFISADGRDSHEFMFVNDGVLGICDLYNGYHTSPVPTTTDAIIATSARYWAIYFNSDGSYGYWGDHSSYVSPYGPPTGLIPKKIRADYRSVITIHSDDTVVVWGETGQTPPTGLKAIDVGMAFTTGLYFYIAIQKD